MAEKKLTDKIPIDELKRRAEAGDVSAQLALGLFYELGIEVPQTDVKEAAKWWGMAAKSGENVAQLSLAEIISNNFDDTDENRAIVQALYKKAEEGGLTRASKAVRLMKKDSGKVVRVLVVDDSPTIRVAMKALLEKEGCTVVVAEDGQEAVNILRKDADFKMIFSDVNMPNLNGFEMVKALKSVEKCAEMPIVMLTTESSPDFVKKGKSLGVKGWLVKPASPNLIRKCLEKYT